MYLVACKWVANGAVSYKKPMDYLELATATSDEIEYAIAVISLGIERDNIYSIAAYYWLENDQDLNKITMTYYNDKAEFDLWNASAPHRTFLANRSKFLNATGITLHTVEKEVTDENDSINYAYSDTLFS